MGGNVPTLSSALNCPSEKEGGESSKKSEVEEKRQRRSNQFVGKQGEGKPASQKKMVKFESIRDDKLHLKDRLGGNSNSPNVLKIPQA